MADSPTTTGGVNIRSIISLVLEQLAFWQMHDPEFRFAPFFREFRPIATTDRYRDIF